ncbi:MAG: winged helix-turn-helix transcriptional regulator [Clostridia bacterium]|nr:winged helix-turn-helix transcriptional regulator [Clostridia bacterium]
MENEYICKEKCPHFNKISEVKLTSPNDDSVIDLADMFKIFADSTRLKIICAIMKEELCVCDLCELLGLNQTTVSHQLKTLRDSKLVKYRRDGKQIFYSLEDDHVTQILSAGLSHISEEAENEQL